jgi:integrase
MNLPKESETARLTGWQWPVELGQYDRSHTLINIERAHLQQLVTRATVGLKGWHPAAKPALERILKPLNEVLDHMGATNAIKRLYTIRTTVICLLVRAMHQHNCTFWAFSNQIWLDLLGRDYYAYVDQHGVTANARQQLIAVAYLLCGFKNLDQLGRLAYFPLARKIFGETTMNKIITDLQDDLRAWGYTKKGNLVALHNALSMVLLTQRNPCLSDITLENLWNLYHTAKAKITRQGLVLLSFVLARRGYISHCIGRDGKGYLKEQIGHRRAIIGVPPVWLQWCERWYNTSTLQPSSRISVLYRLLQVGRWLNQTHPDVKEPVDWNREICAEYVAAVDRATVGQWSSPSPPVAVRFGQPIMARGKEGMLKSVRTFFTDCQEWGWIPRYFNPVRDLRTPRSVRAIIGPDPRIIADATWAKIVWAGLNLTTEDLSGKIDGRYHKRMYPSAMIKALALVWLFTGLRRNEIVRLRLGCIRWQEPAEENREVHQAERKICLLAVPVTKTSTAFTKPIDGLVGEAIAAWEMIRPPQPLWFDPKTGERVYLLFSHRGRPIGLGYLNDVLIPLLCQKAGVPQEDARGKFTAHRARATIASQLFNAKNPLSLFELQEWLGHHSPESTRHYTKLSPTRLVKSFAHADYFARNLRAIEVLIDQEVVKSGAAANGEDWKFYDLGHGYCTYDFFDQCPHRMACAKCSFYRPKGSSQAQLLESKANLQRMLQEIPLTEDERAAVEEGVEAMEKLSKKLLEVPTPMGLTPNQISNTTTL